MKISTLLALVSFAIPNVALCADSPTGYSLQIVKYKGFSPPAPPNFGVPTPPNEPAKPNFEVVCEVSDASKIQSIWKEFAVKFDYKDWQYAIPDARFYSITLIYQGKAINLVDAAPFFEGNPNSAVKSTGIVSGGDKEDMSPKEVEFRAKNSAFKDIMKACDDWQKAHAPKSELQKK